MWEHVCLCVCVVGRGEIISLSCPGAKMQWFLHLGSNNTDTMGKVLWGRMSCNAEMKYKPSLPVVLYRVGQGQHLLFIWERKYIFVVAAFVTDSSLPAEAISHRSVQCFLCSMHRSDGFKTPRWWGDTSVVKLPGRPWSTLVPPKWSSVWIFRQFWGHDLEFDHQ